MLINMRMDKHVIADLYYGLLYANIVADTCKYKWISVNLWCIKRTRNKQYIPHGSIYIKFKIIKNWYGDRHPNGGGYKGTFWDDKNVDLGGDHTQGYIYVKIH